jgi:hypothetical protein
MLAATTHVAIERADRKRGVMRDVAVRSTGGILLFMNLHKMWRN